MNHRWMIAAAAALGFSAHGRENRFDFVVSNVISPDEPSATVEVWATFDAGHYGLAYVAFDVLAEADAGGFSDPQRVLKGPGTNDGEVAPDGDSVLGIVAGQLTFPDCCYVETANPILVWRVTWSTADFAPRTVGLSTETSKFDVYRDEDLDGDGFADGTFDSFLDSLIEGSGAIQVVPAPGGLAAVSVCGIAGLRRGRRRGVTR